MIQLTNTSNATFYGWMRGTTDDLSLVTSYAVIGNYGDLVTIVPGRDLGLGLRQIHVKVTVEPGFYDVRVLHNLRFTPQPFDMTALAKLGVPMVNNTPLTYLDMTEDGPGYLVHFGARVQAARASLWVDLWLHAYPDEPGYVAGEVMVTNSDPRIPTVIGDAPALHISFGAAIPFVAGQHGDRIVESATWADGQARAVPVAFIWPQVIDKADWSSAAAVAFLQVHAKGCEKPYVFGNAGGFPQWKGDVAEFTRRNFEPCRQALLSWARPPLGVAARSGDTGAQEDQLFPGGEARLAGAILPRYLAALSQAKRPCHHMQENGKPLWIHDHPELVIWDGRPHQTGRDQLGKTERLSSGMVPGGWWGPDNEHFLLGSVFVAYRLTGSPALQRILHHHATLWLGMNTVKPGLATSRFFASRAVGYEGLAAWLLYLSLEDRELANDIKSIVPHRLRLILNDEKRKNQVNGVWHTFDTLGTGRRWMPWQLALGAWGMQLMARMIGGHEEAEAEAVRAASLVIDEGMFQRADGVWKTYYSVTDDFTENTLPSSDWEDFGFPLAVATLWNAGLRYDRLRAIRKQMLENGSGRWFAPWDSCWQPDTDGGES